VLVGDPGRGWVPGEEWETVASYRLTAPDVAEDALVRTTNVLAPRAIIVG